jgi:hypothetical protein
MKNTCLLVIVAALLSALLPVTAQANAELKMGVIPLESPFNSH